MIKKKTRTLRLITLTFTKSTKKLKDLRTQRIEKNDLKNDTDLNLIFYKLYGEIRKIHLFIFFILFFNILLIR